MKSLLLFLIFLPLSAHALTPGELAVRAQKEFQSNDYAKAIASWQELWEMGFHNGGIRYNQGNAYWRFGEIGEARWKWFQAQRLSPRDPAIRANLKLAQGKLEKVEPPQGLAWLWNKVPWYRLRLNEFQSLLGTAVFLSAFCLWALQRVLKGQLWYFGWGALLLLPLLYCSSQWIFYLDSRYLAVQGVILTPQAPLRERPTAEAPATEKLGEGKLLRVLRKESDFVLVKTDAGKEGWLQSGEVGEIR